MNTTNINEKTKPARPGAALTTSTAIAEEIARVEAEYETARRKNFDDVPGFDDDALAEIRARRASLTDRHEEARRREAAAHAAAAACANGREQVRLSELLAEIDARAWEHFVDEELAPEAVEISKRLVALVERADQRIRDARGKVQAARALSRALGSRDTVGAGAWERGLAPVVHRVQRRVAESQLRDGVAPEAADLAAEIIEPARTAARFAGKARADDGRTYRPGRASLAAPARDARARESRSGSGGT